MPFSFLSRDETTPFGLCCIGLEWQTEQSLKGLLSILGDKAPGQWRYVDDIALADLVLYEPGNALAQALVRRAGEERLFVPCSNRAGDDPLALRAPVGPSRLVAVLELAVLRRKGHRAAEPRAVTLCQALDGALHEPGVRGVALTASGELGFLSPQHRSLYWPRRIDPDELAKILLGAMTLRPIGDRDTKLLERMNAVVPQMVTWDGALWAIGVSKSSGRLLARLDARQHYRLTRWPDFGLIGRRSTDIRHTALLSQRAFSPESLGKLTGIPPAAVVGFFNAAALCGILREESAPSSADPALVRRELPAESLVGGMLKRLRRAFALGNRDA